MKISIVLNNISGIGGVERVVANLSNQLNIRYSCEVHIISLFSNEKSEVFYKINQEIKVIHLGNKNLKNKRVFKQFLDLHKQEYDYMLCCSVSIAALAFTSRVVSKKNTKIYAWEHSQYDHSNFVIKGIRRFIYPYLDRVITLSRHDGNIFSTYLKNVSVIPNFKSFTSDHTSDYQNHTLISVGRLGHEKGFDMLIDAYKLIHDKIDDWKLEIYGEGKEYNNLNEKIKLYGLEHKILLKSFTPNIMEKYLDASIFICSSRSESFSMVIIEAMECGLPCISFNCKIGPKEIISEGIDGYLVEPFNIRELSNKIELLVSDFKLRSYMGNNAKEKSKEYGVEGIMYKWEEILELKSKMES
ncbi:MULTISPECIES: glycosyltransferase family 4 protein [Bacillus cereus group]|uniref:glycosyltransferase family 4 protein n=1 Tax=Bacillus cereus group TaxID=86661 RepID=UPI002DB64798|nr:glycosyltransferase family 4 protein [Bacillus anthracis]MEB9907334.1 glycosyltransferase family 4 protein [Bacillus anthracis]MEC1954279.1 glycosyltransferase family 4 protein [Bacillus anthracis]